MKRVAYTTIIKGIKKEIPVSSDTNAIDWLKSMSMSSSNSTEIFTLEKILFNSRGKISLSMVIAKVKYGKLV